MNIKLFSERLSEHKTTREKLPLNQKLLRTLGEMKK
jgi:hypothetical protein